MEEDLTGRRRFLAAVAAAGTAGVSGCAKLGLLGGSTATDDGSTSPASSASATPSPSATPAPTPVPFDADATWSMLGGGPGHAGTVTGTVPRSRPDRRWAVGVPGTAHTQPLVASGRVHLTTDRKSVAADVVAGNAVWKGGPGATDTPALVDGTLFAGGLATPGLVALNAADGTRRWMTNLGGPISSPPTVADGTVYVGAGNNLFALDADTGERRWRQRLKDTVAAAPAVRGDRLFAHDGRELWAFDARNGHPQWELEGASWTTAVVAAGERLFVGASRSGTPARVVSVGVDGRERWRAEVGSRIFAAPAVAGDSVYVGDAGGGTGKLRSLDAASGARNWQRDVGPVRGQPVTDGDTIVVTSTKSGSSVVAVDAGGRRLWSADPGPVHGAPTVVDGHVFVSASGGGGERLLALR